MYTCPSIHLIIDNISRRIVPFKLRIIFKLRIFFLTKYMECITITHRVAIRICQDYVKITFLTSIIFISGFYVRIVPTSTFCEHRGRSNVTSVQQKASVHRSVLPCKTKKAVYVYFTSQQILPFGFAEQSRPFMLLINSYITLYFICFHFIPCAERVAITKWRLLQPFSTNCNVCSQGGYIDLYDNLLDGTVAEN